MASYLQHLPLWGRPVKNPSGGDKREGAGVENYFFNSLLVLCPANIFKKFWSGWYDQPRDSLVRFPLSAPERVLGKYFPDFPALVRFPLSGPERGPGG